ncbi:MAG: TIGR04053 family radical SAM/SPASM domain-containing protein [Candidatus Dormibacteria bacterium]
MSAVRTQLRFDKRPLLVFWETTKACALKCQHCRATAVPSALPGELTTVEGRHLLEQVAGFGRPSPILVMTGGDCLARPDLLELTAYARELGLVVALSPSVSPRLRPDTMLPYYEMGVRSVSVSLDGASPLVHDGIRGVPGHHQQTLSAIGWLRDLGFKVQVNTTVMRQNADELADVAALLLRHGVSIWEVFFLVGVGRGTAVSALPAAENEDVCHFLYDASHHRFVVRTVEAPFFRRVVQARRDAGQSVPEPITPLGRHLGSRLLEVVGPPEVRPRAQGFGTRDGMGVLFVGHDGSVLPSGFLPLPLGNVRQTPLAAIYRNHPVLRAIRRADFHGRCGSCSHRHICGGSRARAYAGNGDPLGEDPGCAYQPADWPT